MLQFVKLRTLSTAQFSLPSLKRIDSRDLSSEKERIEPLEVWQLFQRNPSLETVTGHWGSFTVGLRTRHYNFQGHNLVHCINAWHEAVPLPTPSSPDASQIRMRDSKQVLRSRHFAVSDGSVITSADLKRIEAFIPTVKWKQSWPYRAEKEETQLPKEVWDILEKIKKDDSHPAPSWDSLPKTDM